jgi:hypothetical protein
VTDPRRTPIGTLQRRIDRYRDTDPDDDTPAAAVLGHRLATGEEIASADAAALGRSSSLVSVIVKDFERAGYWVRKRRTRNPANGRMQTVAYYLDGGADARPRANPPPVAGRPTSPIRRGGAAAPSANGAAVVPQQVIPNAWQRARAPEVAYPRLGSLMSVRALAIDDDGALVMHLRDGDDSTWQVAVTGWVGAPGVTTRTPPEAPTG